MTLNRELEIQRYRSELTVHAVYTHTHTHTLSHTHLNLQRWVSVVYSPHTHVQIQKLKFNIHDCVCQSFIYLCTSRYLINASFNPYKLFESHWLVVCEANTTNPQIKYLPKQHMYMFMYMYMHVHVYGSPSY